MASVVFGSGHIKTIPGILKIVEIFLQFVICLCISYYGWHVIDLTEAFMFGAIIGIIISLSILIACISDATSLTGILSYQFIIHFCWFIYLIVVSSLLLTKDLYKDIDEYKAGSAFGIITALVYLVDALYSFKVYSPNLFCV